MSRTKAEITTKKWLLWIQKDGNAGKLTAKRASMTAKTPKTASANVY